MRIFFGLFLLVLVLTGCSTDDTTPKSQEPVPSSSASYPSEVIWNDIIYGLSVETISTEQLDEKVGEVKRNIQPIAEKTGDSNVASVGSKLYSIKGKNQDEVIAVEMDGKRYAAYKNGPLSDRGNK